jgi:hypothetical protein
MTYHHFKVQKSMQNGLKLGKVKIEDQFHE